MSVSIPSFQLAFPSPSQVQVVANHFLTPPPPLPRPPCNTHTFTQTSSITTQKGGSGKVMKVTPSVPWFYISSHNSKIQMFLTTPGPDSNQLFPTTHRSTELDS